ncbi:MAG: hypothetical protein WCA55_17400 [Xanthobacteraceae bacterium]
MSLSLGVDVPAMNQYRARAQMRARLRPILVAFSSLGTLTERRLCNIAHVNERERQLWVKSGNAHNEAMMSAFHPTATEHRTRFYVGSVPIAASRAATNNVSIRLSHRRVRGAQAIAAARKVRIEQCRRQFVGLLTFMNASN